MFCLAVNVVSINPCVGSLPSHKIYFSLLSICKDEPISAPKIIRFFPTLPSDNENSECKSNPLPYPLYLYLSRSPFFVSFADPNKFKSVFKSLRGPSV